MEVMRRGESLSALAASSLERRKFVFKVHYAFIQTVFTIEILNGLSSLEYAAPAESAALPALAGRDSTARAGHAATASPTASRSQTQRSISRKSRHVHILLLMRFIIMASMKRAEKYFI